MERYPKTLAELFVGILWRTATMATSVDLTGSRRNKVAEFTGDTPYKYDRVVFTLFPTKTLRPLVQPRSREAR